MDYQKDRESAVEWSKNVMANPEQYVILDSETTGLENDDIIIQLAVIDLKKNTLFDSLFRLPEGYTISEGAQNVHGISTQMLTDAPKFADLYDTLNEILKNKTVLIYNREFDVRLLAQTCEAHGLPNLEFDSDCVMLWNSQFVGEWSDHFGDYKFQRLRGGDHTALGDCYATLKTIRTINKNKIQTKSERVNTSPIGKMIVSDLAKALAKSTKSELARERNSLITRFIRGLFKS